MLLTFIKTGRVHESSTTWWASKRELIKECVWQHSQVHADLPWGRASWHEALTLHMGSRKPLLRLKRDMRNDPHSRGAGGKQSVQVAMLSNEVHQETDSVTVANPLFDPGQTITARSFEQAHLGQLLAGASACA